MTLQKKARDLKEQSFRSVKRSTRSSQKDISVGDGSAFDDEEEELSNNKSLMPNFCLDTNEARHVTKMGEKNAKWIIGDVRDRNFSCHG